ncbi:MAG: DNA polymerase III subunit gamma/tau [Candidatus Omnitrophota bacterium]
MEYLAFALKYRPQNFDEVVGQAHVVSSLRNAIINKRVHHAYLFSGPRGVGKTSLARILAKSLNCFEGPTPKPCGKCASCVEITKGRSLDILEIDGASNRGIDEIRTLRENVKLSAAHSRYKIYIIDEVHMLTQEAFNALLKTLEEPPEHVKFIFATTHPHKILPTILSRCQKFQFNLIPLEQIVIKLKKIAAAEKVKIKDEFLYTIARAASGSIRDAESLFDQLVPIVLEKGALDNIFSFLGIIDEDSLNKMLKLFVEKDLASCLDFIAKIVQEGKDAGIFLNAFIEHCRNLLLIKISPKNFNELSDISPQSKDFICELSKKVSIADILKIINLLIEAKELSRGLNTVRIPFELALIKYCYDEEALTAPSKANPVRSSSPEAGAAPTALASNGVNKPQANAQRSIREKTIRENEASDKLAEQNLAEIEDFVLEEEEEGIPAGGFQNKADESEKEEEDTALEDDVLLQPIRAKWKVILANIRRTRAALASHLSFAQPISSRSSRVNVAFSPKNSFHKESVEGVKKIEFIEEIVSKIMERKIRIKIILKELPKQVLSGFVNEQEAVPETQSNEASKKDNSASGPISQEDDSFLNELLDTFDGRFQNEQ